MKQDVNDHSEFGRHAPRGLVAGLLTFARGCPDSWTGRRLAFAARAVGIKSLRGQPLDVESFGIRMRLYPGHNVAEKNLLFTPQYFDPAERAVLARRLRPERPFVFIDIGANVGGYALFAAARGGPGMRILAIEPQAAIFDRLVYNIRQNSSSSIKALACCVADRDGEITLFLQSRNLAAASMRLVNTDGAASRVVVPAKSLRTLVVEEGFERVDAMKLDAEGAEDLILEPYLRDVAPTLWPKLLILDHAPARWAIDLPRLLIDHGYRVVQRSWTNVIYERD